MDVQLHGEKETINDTLILCSSEESDLYVAKKLYDWIKKYKTPDNINLSQNRVGKVYLISEKDYSEVEAVNQVIESVKWIIVVCSPKTKSSTFCCGVVDAFIKQHGYENMLAVLAKGEPDEAFLEQFFYREKTIVSESGETQIIKERIEPLAANFRGNTKKEINANMSAEYLKVLAPIFGVNFDDLKQRHKEQRNKRNTRIFMSAFFLLVAIIVFSIFSITMNQQQQVKMNSQIDEIIKNEAISLANESQNALKNNDRIDAIKYAYESLTEYEGIEMEYSPEGHRALFESIRPYSLPGDISHAMCDFDTRDKVIGTWLDSENMYFVAYDISETLTVIDLNNNSILYEFSDIEMSSHENFLGETELNGALGEGGWFAYLDDDSLHVIDLNTGEIDDEIDLTKYIIQDKDKNALYTKYGLLYVVMDSKVEVIDPKEKITVGSIDYKDFDLELCDCRIVPFHEWIAAIVRYGTDLYLCCLAIENGEYATIEVDLLQWDYAYLVDVPSGGTFFLIDEYNSNKDFVNSHLCNYYNLYYTIDDYMKLQYSAVNQDKIQRVVVDDSNSITLFNHSTISKLSGDLTTVNNYSAEGVIFKNVYDKWCSVYTTNGAKLNRRIDYENNELYYEKINDYIEFNEMEMDDDLSYILDEIAVMVPKESNRVIIYKSTLAEEYDEESDFKEEVNSESLLQGEDAIQYASEKELYKPYLIDSILFDSTGDYMVASYVDNEARCYKKDTSELIDSFELKDCYGQKESESFYENNNEINLRSVTSYYGKDAWGNDYFGSKDYNYGYILNKEHRFIGAVKNLVGFDEENNDVILVGDDYMYRMQAMGLDKLKEVAKSILNQ